MRQQYRNILAFSLFLFFTTGGVGIPVHHFYCHCKNILITSLLCPGDPCEKAGCPMQSEKDSGKDCADCQFIFVKADIQSIASSGVKLVLKAPPAIRMQGLLRYVPESLLAKTKGVYTKVFYRPSGNQLLPIIQCFLC